MQTGEAVLAGKTAAAKSADDASIKVKPSNFSTFTPTDRTHGSILFRSTAHSIEPEHCSAGGCALNVVGLAPWE